MSAATDVKAGEWRPYRMNQSQICTTQVQGRYWRCLVVAPVGDVVAEARGDTKEQAEAHVHLIASAPDLLDACNALLGLLRLLASRDDVPSTLLPHLTSGHRICEANAAIAKATAQ